MQSSNADGDILVTPVGITISVREEQPKKAWEAISVIAFGKEIAESFVQPAKAYLPMVSTLSGRMTVSRLVQSENA